MLEIKNLHAKTGDKEILKGIDLTVKDGEIHVLMGPNGAGKSTLSYVLAGHPNYAVTEGTIVYNGQDITALSPDQRAAAGIFLAFQYPVEIPGVTNMNFLRTSLNAIRRARNLEPLDSMKMMKRLREKTKELRLPEDILKRAVNVGFSGGEKKRNEMLQMAVLEPSLCLLDETDSGLDIDALRTVAESINAMRSPTRSMLIVTHYQRLLDYIKPDVVHVLSKGRIVKTGSADLALELERTGYIE